MQTLISFLRRLDANNERNWFNAHKAEYQAVHDMFLRFTDELICEISRFDSSVSGLTAKDCTYRIYRDVRFSDDKRPYKTHMGAFICPEGKKSPYSGYYFHVSTGGDGYPGAHMLATGDYCHTPEALRIIREDIVNGEGDFEQTLQQAASVFELDRDGALKRNPKGFPLDAPYSEYIRLKSYCLCATMDDDFICAPDLAKRVADLFKSTKPFLDYINRAIDFSLHYDS